MLFSLVRALRLRMHGALPPIAVIGPWAAETSSSLNGLGYEQVWQREEIQAVLSLYQPGRLFDAIVLAGGLEQVTDLPRAFDQIDASLADTGFLCVSVAESAFTVDSLIALLVDYHFSMAWMDYPELFDALNPAPVPRELRAVSGIFRRVRSGR